MGVEDGFKQNISQERTGHQEAAQELYRLAGDVEFALNNAARYVWQPTEGVDTKQYIVEAKQKAYEWEDRRTKFNQEHPAGDHEYTGMIDRRRELIAILFLDVQRLLDVLNEGRQPRPEDFSHRTS